MAATNVPQLFHHTAIGTGMQLYLIDLSQTDITKIDGWATVGELQSFLNQTTNAAIQTLNGSVNDLYTQLGSKANLALIGVPNGIAPLNGSGLIDTAFLPFAATNYQGTWNATTNTPTLSDGTGTGSEFYWVDTAGTQNLGSGSITFAIGNIVVHNATIWQRVPISSAGVATVNGLTGTVTLTTADIADSVDARYILDSWKDAISNATGTLGASNPLVSRQELNDAVFGTSQVLPKNFTPQWMEDGVNESGNGLSVTLASLGYTSGTANARFPLTAAAHGSINPALYNYDDAVLQECLYYMGQNAISKLTLTGKQYNLLLPNNSLFLPKTLSGVTAATGSLEIAIDLGGTSIRLRSASGVGKIIFSRVPADETESQAIAPYSIDISNGMIHGLSGSTGLKICSTKQSSFRNLFLRTHDIGMELRFCLSATVDTCKGFGCATTSFLFTDGNWSGANPSTSTTQVTGINIYATVSLGGDGVQIINTDSCNFYGGVMENSVAGRSAYYVNQQGTTVCKDVRFKGMHIEQDYTEAAFYIVAQDIGIVNIEDIFQQNVSYLVSLNNISGTNRVVIRNVAKATSGFQFRNQGGGGGAFDFTNVKLPNNPTTPTAVVDPVNAVFDISGSYIAPTFGRVKIDPLTL